MNERRLNKTHPDYKLFKAQLDKIVSNRSVRRKEVESRHADEEDAGKYARMEVEMNKIERETARRIKALMAEYDYLWK